MTITLELDHHASNVLTYLMDKYRANSAQIIVEAINEYYADDIKELERKEE